MNEYFTVIDKDPGGFDVELNACISQGYTLVPGSFHVGIDDQSSPFYTCLVCRPKTAAK